MVASSRKKRKSDDDVDDEGGAKNADEEKAKKKKRTTTPLKKSVLSWKGRDVTVFLREQGLDTLVKVMSARKINGEKLLSLTDERLKEIGLTKAAERKQLLEQVQKLPGATSAQRTTPFSTRRKKKSAVALQADASEHENVDEEEKDKDEDETPEEDTRRRAASSSSSSASSSRSSSSSEKFYIYDNEDLPPMGMCDAERPKRSSSVVALRVLLAVVLASLVFSAGVALWSIASQLAAFLLAGGASSTRVDPLGTLEQILLGSSSPLTDGDLMSLFVTLDGKDGVVDGLVTELGGGGGRSSSSSSSSSSLVALERSAEAFVASLSEGAGRPSLLAVSTDGALPFTEFVCALAAMQEPLYPPPSSSSSYSFVPPPWTTSGSVDSLFFSALDSNGNKLLTVVDEIAPSFLEAMAGKHSDGLARVTPEQFSRWLGGHHTRIFDAVHGRGSQANDDTAEEAEKAAEGAVDDAVASSVPGIAMEIINEPEATSEEIAEEPSALADGEDEENLDVMPEEAAAAEEEEEVVVEAGEAAAQEDSPEEKVDVLQPSVDGNSDEHDGILAFPTHPGFAALDRNGK